MISRPMRAAALAVACCAASLLAAPSARAAPFDGNWNVVVQSPDHCGTTRWMVAIAGGRVFHPYVVYVGGWPASLSGRVTRSGRINIQAVAGPRVASGVGRLGPGQGSGRWSGQGPSGICTGIWTATRVGAPVPPPFAYPQFNAPGPWRGPGQW